MRVIESARFVKFTKEIQHIEDIITEGRDFALYRLPLQSVCHIIGEASCTEEFLSFSALSDVNGFWVSPFVTDGKAKALFIHGEERCFELPDVTASTSIRFKLTDDKPSYFADFDKFSSLLREGQVEKVVLARKAFVQMTYSASDIFHLFLKACQLYPRNFVALWRTAVSGTWLVATPELLLKQESDTFQTMALAGTRSIYEQDMLDLSGWDDKNRYEQQMVADYISSILNDKANIIEKDGPYPSQSGELLHLRTDFVFQTDLSIGEIVQSLHPTPAVCGFPKLDAYDKIVSLESIDRAYYAGFCGPINMNGNSSLYVTLRCMKFVQGGAYAYAGGGLLKESNASEEWTETCRKIETLLKILE